MVASKAFDPEAVVTAKELLSNHNIEGFKQHIKAQFDSSEAIADLIQNLNDNGFLFAESMSPVHPSSTLEHARPVTTFLNTLYAKQCEIEVEREKVAALGSTSEEKVKLWLANNTSTREDLEHLMEEVAEVDKYSELAREVIADAYIADVEEELIVPLLKAEESFAGSLNAGKNRELYTKLLAESENSDDKYNELKELQSRLVSESPELQELQERLDKGQRIMGVDGAMKVLTTQASYEEVEKLIEATEDSDRNGFDSVAAGVTARCLEEVRANYEADMLNHLIKLLLNGKQQDLAEYMAKVSKPELKSHFLEELKQEATQSQNRRFRISALRFLNTLK